MRNSNIVIFESQEEALEIERKRQTTINAFLSLDDSLYVLELSEEAIESIEKAGISNIGELISKSYQEVSSIPDLSETDLQTITSKLASHYLGLK